MRLYLVRHGEAKPKSEDPDRHLTKAGAADVQRVAAFLKGLGLEVDAIWHSPKTRARETAEILASAVAAEEGLVEHSGLAPNDPVGPICKRVEAGSRRLMIVGHLPHLEKLAAALVLGDEQAKALAFPTAAVACLLRKDEGGWLLEWLVTPDILPQQPRHRSRRKSGRTR